MRKGPETRPWHRKVSLDGIRSSDCQFGQVTYLRYRASPVLQDKVRCAIMAFVKYAERLQCCLCPEPAIFVIISSEKSGKMAVTIGPKPFGVLKPPSKSSQNSWASDDVRRCCESSQVTIGPKPFGVLKHPTFLPSSGGVVGVTSIVTIGPKPFGVLKQVARSGGPPAAWAGGHHRAKTLRGTETEGLQGLLLLLAVHSHHRAKTLRGTETFHPRRKIPRPR